MYWFPITSGKCQKEQLFQFFPADQEFEMPLIQT